jgi:hypothetical protein
MPWTEVLRLLWPDSDTLALLTLLLLLPPAAAAAAAAAARHPLPVSGPRPAAAGAAG